MHARLWVSFAGLVAGAASGCHHTDYGQSCPQLLGDVPATEPAADATLTTTQEVVAQNPTFPCEQLICIASAGRPGYCSGKCLDAGACPPGFECRAIQDVGFFAGERFCAWKPCTHAADCGPKPDFCCSQVAGSSAAEPTRLCAYSKGGKCP